MPERSPMQQNQGQTTQPGQQQRDKQQNQRGNSNDPNRNPGQQNQSDTERENSGDMRNPQGGQQRPGQSVGSGQRERGPDDRGNRDDSNE